MAPTTFSHAIRFKGSCHEGAGQRVHERPARRDGLRVVQARVVRKPSGRLRVTGVGWGGQFAGDRPRLWSLCLGYARVG